MAVLPSSPARPLEKATKDTSSSEVDSDEFFYDQTPRPVRRQEVAVVYSPPRRPPKVLKKPATKAKSKPVKGG